MAGDLPIHWQPLDTLERLHGWQRFDLNLIGSHPALFGAFD